MFKTLTSMLLMSALPLFSDTSITIYNDNYALVRENIDLSLKTGMNEVNYPGTTSLLEANSVMLKSNDPNSMFKIIEQNYQSDVVSQSQLLALYEGQEIDFQIVENQKTLFKKGKIIRSGYQPQVDRRYGYRANQLNQALIEIDGQLRFGLPGIPLFPSLGEASLLTPTLSWDIVSEKQQNIQSTLSYMTGGLSWKADYNLIVPENGNELDLSAWITLVNRSGKQFDQTDVKLMAGDVNKVHEGEHRYQAEYALAKLSESRSEPNVKEKSFDEFHLYTLQHKTDLLDKEVKQVEFLTTSGVSSELLYVYDGKNFTARGYNLNHRRTNRNYGAQSHEKVSVVRQFMNTKENNLGVPLPKGKVRFYKMNDDGDLEFVGENMIDHTPKNELVKIHTGNSFDLKGQRKQVDFRYNSQKNQVDESFSLTLKNRKEVAVTIQVVEHLYRWNTWELVKSSMPYSKEDSATIHFMVKLEPNEEKELTYHVKYSW